MAKRDYYEVLGVSRTASVDEIKKAYRKLAKQHHPDQSKGAAGAEDKFKEANEAYEVLSDAEKRKAYDTFGHSASQSGYASGPSGFEGFAGGDSPFGDIFETFFGGGGRAGGRSAHTAGRDIEMIVELSFEESAFGVTRDITFTKTRVCSRCNGNAAEPGTKIVTCETCKGEGRVRRVQRTILGNISTTATCSTCGGEGTIPEKVCTKCHGEGRERGTETVSVKIPPGVDTGSVVRVTGKGEAGYRGGQAGDLYLQVHVRPHKTLTRHEFDILSEVTISIPEAVLGTEVSVETIHGPVTLRIPAGTTSGKKFRIRSKGVQHLGSSTMGDHILTVHIAIPSKLTKRERELYEELGKTEGSGKKKWF